MSEQTRKQAISRAAGMTIADVPQRAYDQLLANVTGDPIPWQVIAQAIDRNATNQALENRVKLAGQQTTGDGCHIDHIDHIDYTSNRG